MTDTLSQLSLLLIIGAIAIYAAAFVTFALDLARRRSPSVTVISAVARHAEAETPTSTTRLANAIGNTGVLVRQSTTSADAHEERPQTSGVLRAAFVLTLVGFGLHLGADVLRGIAAGRVPWANMWEFSMTGTLIIVGVFLLVTLKYDLRFLGTFVIGLVLLLLGIASARYYVPVAPLPPALQSYWLVIHVIVAIIATGFFALGFALSGVQLLKARRERQETDARPPQFAFLRTLPKWAALENLAYRMNIVGFILWTFTLIAGAIWAEKAWGRYWGWDTKEVWTFIIWVLYAGYIHARATRGWRGSRSAWLALIGFSAVMFNFGIVNVFFKGLHSYSGL
ncbi:c-type cytochrome biogenesis protein CcsB [Humibacter albus]|uniref:c-type cytochrome biogenesis protein CcsB n=1 Tax=Humibacter albus TaxID=427754 RepID=UPI0003B43604|nr:c-type cytochrome biogenesis protein CcsB [Humibacter albus]